MGDEAEANARTKQTAMVAISVTLFTIPGSDAAAFHGKLQSAAVHNP